MSAIMEKSKSYHRFLKHSLGMACSIILLVLGLPGIDALQARQSNGGAILAQSPTQAPVIDTQGQDQGQTKGKVRLDLNIRDLMPDMLLAAPQPAGSEPIQGYAAPGRTRLMLGQLPGAAAESGSTLMPLISNDSRRYIKAPVERIMPELDQPTVDDDQPTVGLHMEVDF